MTSKQKSGDTRKTLGSTYIIDRADPEVTLATTVPDTNFTLGTSFNSQFLKGKDSPRFTFVETLGEGTQGVVWKANDEDIGRTVAIKTFKHKGAHGHRLCENEIRIAGRIDHPNIPIVYNIEKTKDESFHSVMKFVEGEPLTRLIDRWTRSKRAYEAFRVEKRIGIVIQILRALSAAHKNGILHRDIKPENILICKNGEVYLMDWGIALSMLEASGATQLAGSPRYMSPEQAGVLRLDQRSDLYAVGVILFEMVHLRHPGPDLNTVEAILETLPTFEHKQLTMMDPHPVLRGVLNKALKNNPEERYQSAEHMLKDLEAIIEGDIEICCPNTAMLHAMYRFSRALNRRPALFGMGGMIGVITIMASLVFLGTLL